MLEKDPDLFQYEPGGRSGPLRALQRAWSTSSGDGSWADRPDWQDRI